MASPTKETAKRAPEVQEAEQEVGWDGEVRSGRAGRLKDLEDAARKERDALEELGEEKPKMEEPDYKRHHFNERPDGTMAREKKVKEDPWKQHGGAPSETWQPEAWSPSVATKR